jgi:hypothetical protein
MSNQKTPTLILPPNLQAQKAAEQREKELQELKSKKVKLPPELSQEVKKHLPQAQDINEKVGELLKSQAGWIALLSQESFKKLMGDYVNSTLPSVVLEACKLDRISILNAMQQVMANELTTAQVNKTDLDPASYQKAIAHLASVFQQAPVPPLNLQISLPEFEFEPSPEDQDSKPVPD